jgi:putative MFS transporter
LIALTPGQFPKIIRGTAMGTAQSIGRIGATVGPFVVGWLFDAGFEIHGVFGLFVGLLIIALIVLWFGVKDENIEDVTESQVADNAAKL